MSYLRVCIVDESDNEVQMVNAARIRDAISNCLGFFSLYGKWYNNDLDYDSVDPDDYFKTQPSKMSANILLVYKAFRYVPLSGPFLPSSTQNWLSLFVFVIS